MTKDEMACCLARVTTHLRIWSNGRIIISRGKPEKLDQTRRGTVEVFYPASTRETLVELHVTRFWAECQLSGDQLPSQQRGAWQHQLLVGWL
jgi:hypothetical protein